MVDTALSPRFLRWRWSVFLSMFCGWSCHILIRKNFPSSITSLVEHQGFSRSDVGKISSCFAVTYGFSKLFGSLVSDRASPQFLFSRGLILAGIFSLAFPLTHTVTLACAVWFLEGIMQGFGWPPLVILLKAWYPPSQIGRWWSILSSAGSIMSAVLPLLVVFLTSISHWSMSFYVFGLFSIVVGVLVNFTMRDSPEDIGVASFLPKKESKSETAVVDNGSWYQVFFHVDLWVVSVIYTILYFVTNSCFNWSQLFFIEEVGMSETAAAAASSMFQVGAFMGNIFSGFLSDFLITPRTVKCPCPRAPFLLGVSTLLVISLHLFRTTVDETSSEVWINLLMFIVGLLVTGGVSVVGLTAMEVVPKHMVASAHGLACAVAQVGTFVAGWPFTLVVESHGWNTAYGLVEYSLLLMIALSLYLVKLLMTSYRKLKTN